MGDKKAIVPPKDYRHYICIAITLGFLGMGFMFPNALPRLGEVFRDLGTSVVYYGYGLFADSAELSPLRPTVNDMQAWEFVPSPWEPISLFPWTWEEFKVLWHQYWALFVSKENVEAFWWKFTDVIAVIGKVLTLLLPLAVPIFFKARSYTEPKDPPVDENGDPLPPKIEEDTRSLKCFKRILFATVYPAVRWAKDFLCFLRENDRYYKAWLFIWAMYFNLFSIAVAAVAFYFYIVISRDVVSLYTQLVKLLGDLTPMIRFLPGLVWIGLGLWFLDHSAKERGYDKLEHNECKNRGFLNERGVVTVIWGNMGTGKTRMLTSLALSAEKQLRDDALEILLETDMKFPNFPWGKLRHEVKRRMEEHLIVDVFSIRSWIREWKSEYLYLEKHRLIGWFRKKLLCKPGLFDLTFGYDTKHYRTTYNDNLTVTHFYDAINDYAQAFFVYSIQTSLIFSNYSIRVDLDATRDTDFPLYNDDFFRRKPEYRDMYSRYCHILDFDMLRLGKRMLEENPNKNALGFGVYVVSEIDKERKNELELRKSASSRKLHRKNEEVVEEKEPCTQSNDLFNACLKMIRHATVIANRVFVRVLCDLQRPEDWGAGGRAVGEVVFIESKGDKSPVLPFYSPYWLLYPLHAVSRAFTDFYKRYLGARNDNTLLLYLMKNVNAVFSQYVDRTEKLFGSQTFKLEVESGRLEGKLIERKFYGMDKKDFSARYCTDAMSSIFDLPNTVSIADFAEYADIMATKAERDLQNSHFQKDINENIAA